MTVHCWGAERAALDGLPPAVAHQPWDALAGKAPHLAALQAVSIDLTMAAAVEDADVVHSHTWYANFAGHLARLLYGHPHVATVHSLEPLRPWKSEQLAGGYALSSFCERTALEAADAIIAVSAGQRRDIVSVYPSIDPAHIEVIHNGIDAEEYQPDRRTDVLERYGVDPDQAVGRLRRAHHAAEGRALPARGRARHRSGGAARALRGRAGHARARGRGRAEASTPCAAPRGNVIWLDQMLAKDEVIQLLSHATVFVCPSIYEPQGIVNLEAMACEAAVVATDTGGIPEVVDDGVTGLLVPFATRDDGSGDPLDPKGFVAGIADRVNELLADPDARGGDGHRRSRAGDRALRLAGHRGADGRALPKAPAAARGLTASYALFSPIRPRRCGGPVSAARRSPAPSRSPTAWARCSSAAPAAPRTRSSGRCGSPATQAAWR